MVAHEFERVAPLDQAEALGGQALELDRLDLGAVLFGLALALRLLVEIELAFDAGGLAVEQVDERPQQIGEIVLELFDINTQTYMNAYLEAASCLPTAARGRGQMLTARNNFLSGCPASQRRRLSTNRSVSSRFSALTVDAECGEISTFSIRQSGEEAGSGSVSKTSRQAPPR